MIDYQWFIQPTVSIALLIALFNLFIKKRFDVQLEEFKKGVLKEVELIKIINQVTFPARLTAFKDAMKQSTNLRKEFQFAQKFYGTSDTAKIKELDEIIASYKTVVDESSIFFNNEIEQALVDFGNQADSIRTLSILLKTFSTPPPISDYTANQITETQNKLTEILISFPEKEGRIRNLIRAEVNSFKKYTA